MKNQHSVLVIDDEQIICDSCNRILSSNELKVETNTNPIEGYENALKNDYDLLLLDLNMAGMDGMQLLNKLRKDKPELPVIIITGYPTKETKENSKNLGVSDYVLKPFKPEEIIDPVRSILNKIGLTETKESIIAKKQSKTLEWKATEKNYHFYKNGWLQKGTENYMRIGGQLPVFINEAVTSVKTLNANEKIYRGLPIAELDFGTDLKITIPSPVTGEIIDINQALVKDPALFDEEDCNNNWIADILPDKAEEELQLCETRNIFLLSQAVQEKNKYLHQLSKLGYIVNTAKTFQEASALITATDCKNKVIIIDAETYGESGPQLAEELSSRFKDIKIIVFNLTDSKLETLYREKKIFYYAVDPVSNREITSIVYGAFCFAKDKEVTENVQKSFLPQTIRRIQITNRNSKKVVLLAFDNTIKFNKGVGYILIQSLLDNSYPIEIVHSKNINRVKDPSSAQFIAEEKLKNDKIIILYKDQLNKLTGSIVKNDEKYENSNGNDNTLSKIALQPVNINDEEVTFDPNTTRALAQLIEKEMTAIC